MSLMLLGFLPIITNSRPENLDAITFAFYLSFWQLIFSVPLLIYEFRGGKKGILDQDITPPLKRLTFWIILITGLIFSLSTYLYVLSFEKAGTVTAAIAVQTYPLFAILIESIFFKTRKNTGELISTIFLVFGIYYLGTEGTWIIKDLSIWFLLALIVPVLWSIAHTIIRFRLNISPITPNQITFFRVTISSIILLIISTSIIGLETVISGFSDPKFQISSILMGLFYYLELVNWFYAIKHIDVSLASSITTPTPVITMILAIIFLQETISSYEIISMIIVIMSLYGILYFGRSVADN